MLRKRLDEKFARGADNQSFLVETVNGIGTVKATAVDTRMFGGAGDDDYYYQAGSGSDLVYAGGGTDWVFFDGIDRTRLAFHQHGNDLIVRVDADANQQARVANHFLGGEHAIGYVQPGSGFAIPASQIPSLLTPLPGSAAVAAGHDAAADARTQLDYLIAAITSFNPAETSITEFGPVCTPHYQLAATS